MKNIDAFEKRKTVSESRHSREQHVTKSKLFKTRPFFMVRGSSSLQIQLEIYLLKCQRKNYGVNEIKKMSVAAGATCAQCLISTHPFFP